MTESMYIGSGDVTPLLAGLNTKGYSQLLTRFVSGVKPFYNAKASPIDALRTGAILEERYGLTLDDDYYPQVRVVSDDMDVLRCTLDFAKLGAGEVVDFDEVKSCNFDDFMSLESYRDDAIELIKKRYRNYYNQIQQQLYCTGLLYANLSFFVVYSYDDEVNMTRVINDNEIIKFRIARDEDVIRRIKERASIFQLIKDYYKQ